MNCPACSAALEVGATWCPTCGAIVPPPPPAPAAGPPPVDPVRSAANKAIAIALLAPCCGPVGLLSGFFAIRAIKLGRLAKQLVPNRAGIALALSVLSVLFWMYLVVSIALDSRERRQQREAVQQRLAGKREAAVIDAAAACDLVEEQLRAGLHEGWYADRVTCHGPLDSATDRAVLKGVEMEYGVLRIRLNACLARAQRWFVFRVTSGDSCPEPPGVVPGATPDVGEDAARRESASQADAENVAAFLSRLEQAKDAVAAGARHSRSCPSIDAKSLSSSKQSDQLLVRTVELELLNARAGTLDRPQWTFLTSPHVRTALDVRQPMRQRAAAVHRISLDGGPYLVVYRGDDWEWPEIQQEAVWGGHWTGSMVLVDLRNAQPICEARLVVETPAQRRGRSDKKRLQETVAALKEQFEDEATAGMKAMSERRLRLGYKLLE